VAEPNRTRSKKLRTALHHVNKIDTELQRNNMRAEQVLTEIEQREQRVASRQPGHLPFNRETRR